MRSPAPSVLLAAVLALAAAAVRAEILILTHEHLTAEAFPEAAVAIRSHLLEGGAHARLTLAQKDRVDTFLDRIQGYLDAGLARDRPKIGQMQLRINTILAPQVAGTHNTSDLICRYEAPVGTRIRETRCYHRRTLEEGSRYIQHELIQKLEPGGP